MSALSAAERLNLSTLNDEQTASPAAKIAFEAGRALADSLRCRMPDIDDVTIGRVALATIAFMNLALAANGQGDSLIPAIEAATDQIICASLDLTASEWQEAKL